MLYVVTSTFLMMLGAFIIGFGVAYLIKIISLVLGRSDNPSSGHTNIRKNFRNMIQTRRNQLKELLLITQSNTQDKLIDHFYPSQSENNNDFDISDDELKYFYYEKY